MEHAGHFSSHSRSTFEQFDPDRTSQDFDTFYSENQHIVEQFEQGTLTPEDTITAITQNFNILTVGDSSDPHVQAQQLVEKHLTAVDAYQLVAPQLSMDDELIVQEHSHNLRMGALYTIWERYEPLRHNKESDVPEAIATRNQHTLDEWARLIAKWQPVLFPDAATPLHADVPSANSPQSLRQSHQFVQLGQVPLPQSGAAV